MVLHTLGTPVVNTMSSTTALLLLVCCLVAQSSHLVTPMESLRRQPHRSIPVPWPQGGGIPINASICTPQLFFLGPTKAGANPWTWYLRLVRDDVWRVASRAQSSCITTLSSHPQGFHPRMAVPHEPFKYWNLWYNTSQWPLDRYVRQFPWTCKRDDPLNDVCTSRPSGRCCSKVRNGKQIAYRSSLCPTPLLSSGQAGKGWGRQR